MLSFTLLITAAIFFTLVMAGLLFTIYAKNLSFTERVRVYFSDAAFAKPEVGGVKEKRARLAFLRPYWEMGLKQTSQYLSPAKRKELDSMLRDAGYWRMSAMEFRLLQLVLSIGAIILALVLFTPSRELSNVWIIAIAMGVLAYRYPFFHLGRRKAMRMKAIQRSLPDFFDTVNLLLEAGLGLDAAIATVCRRSEGPLSEEFLLVLEDMKLGKSRREAFYDLRKRVPSSGFQGVITSLIQADQLGIGMAKVLKTLTVRIREQQREAAREQAMKAPVKMLLPMVFLIFPSLFIVILGPFVIKLITQGL
ncbi:type II secretion system F family protein [Ectobacillus ponti]|uniref:Type II secretion system F family protein n=1 Tax=Ectobacillus ponti TaxID=2961894 RepID=A0AA42BTC4_9BACI|nr:type II secretion system F family protein [Ectobacillus ponti]MCP8969328.1 type II secretion system F family protein [Ectobacillus ponti]